MEKRIRWNLISLPCLGFQYCKGNLNPVPDLTFLGFIGGFSCILIRKKANIVHSSTVLLWTGKDKYFVRKPLEYNYFTLYNTLTTKIVRIGFQQICVCLQ